MQDGAAPGDAGQRGLEDAHRELLTDPDIQFAFPPVEMRPVRPPRGGPNWLTELFEALGPVFQVLADRHQVLQGAGFHGDATKCGFRTSGFP